MLVSIVIWQIFFIYLNFGIVHFITIMPSGITDEQELHH